MGTDTKKKPSRRGSADKLGQQIEHEVEQLISYLNDEVVPAVRQHSSRALKIAAERLAKLADYMDDKQKRGS